MAAFPPLLAGGAVGFWSGASPARVDKAGIATAGAGAGKRGLGAGVLLAFEGSSRSRDRNIAAPAT